MDKSEVMPEESIVVLTASLLSHYDMSTLAARRYLLEAKGWYKYSEHRDTVAMEYKVVMHRPVYFTEIEALLEGGPDENL